MYLGIIIFRYFTDTLKSACIITAVTKSEY